MSQYATRYYQLCDQRDAVNAKVAPLQVELDAAIGAAQQANANAAAIAEKISQLRGGEAWLGLKKEIATLARALGRIPARETPEATEQSAA